MTNESETTPKTDPMAYGVGDEITIMRGLDRGKHARILGADATNRKYNVQFTDGSFAVVNEVNVKPPAEGTVTASKLADLVNEWADSQGDADALISLLSNHVDGFAKAIGDE
jgi:hypothetical protein